MSDDDGTYSIRVVDEDGNPVSGAKVQVQCGLISGVGTEYTDSDGWAEFDIVTSLLGNAIHIERVWVNDEEVSDDGFTPEDGDTFSFTLP